MDKLSGLSFGLPPMMPTPQPVISGFGPLSAPAGELTRPDAIVPDAIVPEAIVSEAIVSVLASDSSLERLYASGSQPVLADVDPECGGLSRAGVEAQIGVDTKEVWVEPDHGSYANWEGVQRAIAERSIVLQIEGKGNVGEWVRIAPGLRGWGMHLVEVDARDIVGGAGAAVAMLQALGVAAQAYDTQLAFERPTARVRGRRRDFPGALAWQSKMIVVENWEQKREALVAVARELARQMSLDFGGGEGKLGSKPAQREEGDARRGRKSA